MTYVATASRSSREAWAAIRDSGVLLGPAAVAGHPLDLELAGHVDHDDGVEACPPGRVSASSGMSWTTTASARRLLLELDDPLEDQRVHDRLEPATRLLVGEHQPHPSPAGRARRRRRAAPSPNSSTTAASPGVPCATTSRASSSASMTTAPSSAQDRRDGALARGDAPGQSHANRHAGIIPVPAGGPSLAEPVTDWARH